MNILDLEPTKVPYNTLMTSLDLIIIDLNILLYGYIKEENYEFASKLKEFKLKMLAEFAKTIALNTGKDEASIQENLLKIDEEAYKTIMHNEIDLTLEEIITNLENENYEN
jgi:hypothetical protein